MVEFYPWFKFYFLLIQTHYRIIPFAKTKANRIYANLNATHDLLIKMQRSNQLGTESTSYPDVSLSLDKNVLAKKAGRRQRAKRCFACRLNPSHGPLRFITPLPCEKTQPRSQGSLLPVPTGRRENLGTRLRKTKCRRRRLGLN